MVGSKIVHGAYERGKAYHRKQALSEPRILYGTSVRDDELLCKAPQMPNLRYHRARCLIKLGLVCEAMYSLVEELSINQ